MYIYLPVPLFYAVIAVIITGSQHIAIMQESLFSLEKNDICAEAGEGVSHADTREREFQQVERSS